jgi:glycosyltransferase involved in cell wall biosynthesis
MAKHEMSVVVATYKGASTLRYVLEGLKLQTFDDFEIVAVVKPSDDGTLGLLRKNSKSLRIKVITQMYGNVVDAEALGIKHSQGKVIVFLDDDAVPEKECLEEHFKVYADSAIGGVAGDMIVSRIVKDKVEELEEIEVPPSETARTRLSARVWDRPVSGLEQYRCCVTKCGSIWHGFSMTDNPVGNYAYWRKRGMTWSFLGIGANMSVLASAVKDMVFERTEEWKRGYGWEQALAWHVWKKGYGMVLNPKAQVQHIFSGDHLTGGLYAEGLKNPIVVEKETGRVEKPSFDNVRERNLFFYRLHRRGSGLSLVCKFCSVLVEALFSLRNVKNLDGFGVLKALCLSNATGVGWLLSKNE